MMLAAVVVLSCGVGGMAQENGRWRAVSSTARSITGDIAIANEKMTINFMRFTIAEIRGLEVAEAGAMFGGEGGAAGSGKLYRLEIPAETKFLGKNSMCGSEETQWMATYVSGKNLQLAFFSGPKMPVFTAEAIGNSTALCGTFTYVR